MKRAVVATIFGLIMGGVCASGAFYAGFLKFSVVSLLWILLNRAVMGFVIGTSGLKWHWAWNGIVLGMITGSIFSYYLYMTLGTGLIPVMNFFVNGVFGLIIEFFTSVVFKQRISPAQPIVRAATAV